MTPEEAVGRLAAIVATTPELSENEVYAEMASRGVSASDTDRAYKFTQLAWGRVFLQVVGVRFSPDYLCFDGAGELVELGALAQEPFYRAALALAPRVTSTPGFLRLAVLSSDVNAVNNALNAGSKPNDLVAAPAALFLEPATPEAIEKARRRIAEYLPTVTTGEKKPASEKKPWWRLW